MGGRRAIELLSLPVRMHGIELGRPVDALLDPHADRLIGFELLCGDGAHRFLPFAVASVRADEIVVSSALALVDERGLGFYRANSRRLSQSGLADPWVDERGGVGESQSAA